MNEQRSRLELVVGLSVVLGMLTGILALGAAVFAFGNFDWMALGICLAAAALAFGLIANAVLRH